MRVATPLVLLATLAITGCTAAATDSSSSSPPTTTSESTPLAGRVVVLDPGHNGGNATHPEVVTQLVPAGRGRTKPCNTTGSQTDDGYPEHAFAWDVSVRVRDLLAARGATVVLTRPDDGGIGPCVDQRAATANAAGADAVVSVHADGSSAQDSGFHVAYSDPPLNPAQGEPAAALATAVRDALREAGFTPADYLGSDGLHGRDDLAGLNLAERPSVLVECANLRNPVEAAVVATPQGRASYAQAIAEGIERFLRP